MPSLTAPPEVILTLPLVEFTLKFDEASAPEIVPAELRVM